MFTFEESIVLHNVNRRQQQFIDAFGAHVLAQLESTA
jgi:hypothetical protein